MDHHETNPWEPRAKAGRGTARTEEAISKSGIEAKVPLSNKSDKTESPKNPKTAGCPSLCLQEAC